MSCCGKDFELVRALNCHQASHRPCPLCESFSGSRSALDVHLWSVHSIGRPPPAAPTAACPVNGGAEFTRRDGSAFQVVEEGAYAPKTLEQRFPGASLWWAAAAPTSHYSQASMFDAPTVEPDQAGHPAEAMSLPIGCRICLILGATGSGKSRLLRALSRPSEILTKGTGTDCSEGWAADRSILDAFADGGDGGLGIGREGMRWLSTAGLGSVPLWCQPFQALSTGEVYSYPHPPFLAFSAFPVKPLPSLSLLPTCHARFASSPVSHPTSLTCT